MLLIYYYTTLTNARLNNALYNKLGQKVNKNLFSVFHFHTVDNYQSL